MVAPRVPAPDLLRSSVARSRAAEALATWPVRAGDMLLLWLERYRQRRALGALSDHMLKDLGLSRSDAGRETGKRFWES